SPRCMRATPRATLEIAASRSTAAWDLPGRTTFIFTFAAPKRRRRCSETRRFIASALHGWSLMEKRVLAAKQFPHPPRWRPRNKLIERRDLSRLLWSLWFGFAGSGRRFSGGSFLGGLRGFVGIKNARLLVSVSDAVNDRNGGQHCQYPEH